MKDCTNTFIKIFLFLFTFILVIVGFIILGLGVYFRFTLSKAGITAEGPKIFAILVIVSGFFTSLISCAGFCGVLKENKCLLYTYAEIVFVLAVFQLVLAFCLNGIIGGNSSIVRNQVIKSMKKYPSYERDDARKIAIDKMQWHYSCCGWEKGPEDWRENFKEYIDELPRSCCFDPEGDRDENMRNLHNQVCTMKTVENFKKGCAFEIKKLFLLIIFIIFCCLTAVALIQLTAACFASIFGAAIL
ncbi:CD63 antigen-like isoform X2 [Dinothrombium tinctorium]|uniref:Tetraspanin n=1 Tax=Dinothrombium tinctorium TaxID=1965070 RepID=A0A3S4Q7F0_9ACAR|nr:CD63 antigen-like isoform X2 [Dinothrombium tinctorium]RWS01273.1 CD63 antigen-like isoform X2 [Dinothrombium tinctorium]RWS01613.1 CD63 antigen-like isoform X2 [Dinothrombium tinctorium]